MQIRKLLCGTLAAACLSSQAGAASSSMIQEEINSAKSRQDQAHQIAEYVRSFGEDDSHPAIQFAKQKWAEQDDILTRLYQQYDTAVAEEQLARQEQEKGAFLGRFRISHYCPCAGCNGGSGTTAIGAPLSPWYTIAVDPSIIPLNSTVYIEGYGSFKAQDTGGAIKGNRIDVCVGSHAEAMSLGITYRDVYILK